MCINLISKNKEIRKIKIKFPILLAKYRVRKLLKNGYVFEQDSDVDIAVTFNLY
jgi:hypothetical protein